MTDHYQTLGVARDATPAEIKKAYRKLASKHHSDRVGGDHDTMANITVAYRILSDPDKRTHYDKTGGEKSLTDVEAQAAQMIAAAFNAYLESGSDDEDPVARIRESINTSVKTTEAKIIQLRASIRRIERKAKQVVRKRQGEDLYAAVVRDRIRKLEADIANCNQYLEMAAKGIELMADYEFTGPEQSTEERKRAKIQRIFDAQYESILRAYGEKS